MLSKIIARQFSSAAGKRVGVIGLGNMGGPMAGNLVKNGWTVKGFDLSDKSLEAAEKSVSLVYCDILIQHVLGSFAKNNCV